MLTNNIPLGFRFCPSDVELTTYLVWKIIGTPSSGDGGLIIDADIFGKTPPWALFNTGDGAVKYFFTLLKKKSKNGSNFKRTVDHFGTWKGETQAVKIKDPQTGDVIGEKKTFTFRPNINSVINKDERQRTRDHGDCKWLMTEYALAGVNVTHKKSDSDYVLCRIKKKSKSKQYQEEEEEEDVEQNTSSTIPQNLENMAVVSSNYVLPCASNSFQLQFEDSINPVGVEQFYNYNYYNVENPQICLGEWDSTQVPIGGEGGNYYVENNNNNPYSALGEEGLMSNYSAHPFNVENNNFNPFEDVLGQPVDDVDAEIVAQFLLEDFCAKPEKLNNCY